MNNSDITIKISRPQNFIMNCRERLILDMAGQAAGKTMLIGLITGFSITDFPGANGFIGANTEKQLSDATMKGVLKVWTEIFGWTRYTDTNKGGDYVISKIPPPHFTKLTELDKYKNVISFRNGTIVWMGALVNYTAHDGKEFAWAHLDETKDTKEEALTDVILGRLRQPGVWHDKTGATYWETDIAKAQARGLHSWQPCYIHTTPKVGVADWIAKMFKLNDFEDEIRERVYKKSKDFFSRKFDKKAVCIYSTHHNAKNIAPSFIDDQISILSAAKIDRNIYGLPFSKNGGEYFPSFERRDTCRKVPRLDGLAYHLSLDFNSKPYMTMICGQLQYLIRFTDTSGAKHDEPALGRTALQVLKIRLYKEYCLKSPNHSTEGLCKAFIRDHEEFNPEVFYYGDPSGLSRIPGLGALTNFKIVEQYLASYIHNYSKRVKAPAIGCSNRRELMDNIFAGKFPEIEMEIDEEECPETIKDFEKCKEGKNGEKAKKYVKDKETGEQYQELGHCFVGETMIQTLSGAKRIDSIIVGDMVLTRDGYKRVLKVFDNGIKEIYSYKIEGQIIRCTPNHKVFTFNRGFIEAQHLIRSDIICIFDKKTHTWKANCKLSTDTTLEDTQQVRGLQIEHTSGRGLQSIVNEKNLVHNGMFGYLFTGILNQTIRFIIKMKTQQTTILRIWNRLQGKNMLPSTLIQRQEKKLLEISYLTKLYLHQKNGMEVKMGGHGIKNMQLTRSQQNQHRAFALNVQNHLSKRIYRIKDIVHAPVKSSMAIIGSNMQRRVYDIQVEGNHEYFANNILVHNCSDAVEYMVSELLKEYIKKV